MTTKHTDIRDAAIWTMAGLAFLIAFFHYKGYTSAAADMAYVGVVGCLGYAAMPFVERAGRRAGNRLQKAGIEVRLPEITQRRLIILAVGVVPPALFVVSLHFYEPMELLQMQMTVINAIRSPVTPLIVFALIVVLGMSDAWKPGER